MKTVSNISAPASIIGFLIPYFSQSKTSTNFFQYICLIVFLVTSAIIIYVDIKNRRKRYKTEKGINNYMCKWISHIGRIVIFTRDMSWAIHPRVKDKLIQKAQADELTICMPSKNALAQELEHNGATIATYNHLNYAPVSRFTIVRFGGNGARIAIGKWFKKYNIIEELEAGEHPLFYVAEDLLNIIIKQNEYDGKI
ncbi:MAG: hypothetical protein JST68_12575 [Bacteroidetes bacterium]|nr:hypothetical protein [Bacteroidota bacterium]